MGGLELNISKDGFLCKYGCVSMPMSHFFLIVIFSVCYYLLYHAQANLHDIAHYIVSGIANFRDHTELIYPYSSMNPGDKESVYSFFQDNGRLLDLQKSYPSKLYSSMFGFYYLITGTLSFFLAHVISTVSIIFANLLLYAISLRLFKSKVRFLFISAIAFTPLIASVVCPSNDLIGFFFGTFVLWACLCSSLNFLTIGALIGFFSHFRSQIIFYIIIVPLFMMFIVEKRLIIRKVIEVLFGFICAYIVIVTFFKIWIDYGSFSGSGGGIDFYIKHFSNSFYGFDDYVMIAKRMFHNVVNLGKVNYLYIYVLVFLGILIPTVGSLQKSLIFSALLIVFFPFIIYTFDRFSDPHPRYYVGAVPFLALSWFLGLDNVSKKYRWLDGNWLSLLTVVIVLVPWFFLFGVPMKNVLSFTAISSRLHFLEFKDASNVLMSNFEEDDLIITNHALPSGLTTIKNFIPCPSFSEFKKGDNKEVDGLVFVYEVIGDPFFRPVDWMQNDKLPPLIRDDHGSSFLKLDTIKSSVENSDGVVEAEAILVIYKNIDNQRIKLRDASGKRIFQPKFHEELTELRIQDNSFEDPFAWNGVLEAPSGNFSGVVVGPGPDHPNVLSQRFLVRPGEALRLVANASSLDKALQKGRLQVNWLDQDGKFLGTEISIFRTTEHLQQFRRTVSVPENAYWGIVYVSPHGKNDVVIYDSIEVRGLKYE